MGSVKFSGVSATESNVLTEQDSFCGVLAGAKGAESDSPAYTLQASKSHPAMLNYRSNSAKIISAESPTNDMLAASELLQDSYNGACGGQGVKSLGWPFLTIGVFGEIYLGEVSDKSRVGEAGSHMTTTMRPAVKQP